MVRISSIPSGRRLILVRIRSGIGEGLVARQDVHADIPRGGQLGVDGRLDRIDEIARHRLELEVHPARPRLHVAPGDEGSVVAPYDAAQGVEGRVGPHQGEAPSPVEVDLESVIDRRRRALGRIELMDDLAAGLARRADGPRPAVGRAEQQAAIRWLAAPARIEDGPVEDHERGLAGLDVAHGRARRPRVGVRVADLGAGGGHPARRRRRDGISSRSASRSCWGAPSRRNRTCRRPERARRRWPWPRPR